jgi:hypothetical protein
MQWSPVAAGVGRGPARLPGGIVRLVLDTRRCRYVKGQESCGMLRKHPESLTLSVPPHKR